MQNNIIRHHRLGGTAAPKNVALLDRRVLGFKELARAAKDDIATVMETPMNVASTILNFSRKHGGSLANKLKLKEMGKAALGFLLKPGEMINKWLVLWAHNVGLSAFLSPRHSPYSDI